MLWVLHTGSQWRSLPECYGPWQTIYGYFSRWARDGTFERVVLKLQIRLARLGRFRSDLWCVDGSSIRASRSAAGGGKRGGSKNRRTMRWGVPEAASVRRSTSLATGAGFPLVSSSRRAK